MTEGYQALRESAAWFDISTRGRIRATGEDRKRLLHAMSTNHVQDLEPGQGLYSFFLNAQGRVLADAVILCAEDHLLISTEPETRQKVFEHIDRFIIADDVTLEGHYRIDLRIRARRAAGCGIPERARRCPACSGLRLDALGRRDLGASDIHWTAWFPADCAHR